METKSPKVSVIIPSFNSVKYLPEAIESVLQQDFTDFELLIFDDYSTDGTIEYLKLLKDPRVKVFFSSRNMGQAIQLNNGLDEAKGEYVAIMHADDICYSQRLSKQVDYLQKHPSLGVIGTAIELIGNWQSVYPKSKGEFYYPVNTSETRWSCLLGVPVAHPTVMLRKSFFNKYNLRYDQDFVPAEDYLMWVKSLGHFEIGNLNDILLKYRIHDYQISIRAKDKEETVLKKIRWEMLHLFLPTEEESFLKEFYTLLYDEDVNKFSDKLIIQFYKWSCTQTYFPVKLVQGFLRHKYNVFLYQSNNITLSKIFNPRVLKIIGWANYKQVVKKRLNL